MSEQEQESPQAVTPELEETVPEEPLVVAAGEETPQRRSPRATRVAQRRVVTQPQPPGRRDGAPAVHEQR
jgi:hypothetical protein